MFINVGEKIKGFALWFMAISIISSIIVGIRLLTTRGLEVYGVLVFLAGFLSAWLSALMLYGFGQMIEDTNEMKSLMKKLVSTSNLPSSSSINSITHVIPQSPPSGNKAKEDFIMQQPEKKTYIVDRSGETLACPACGFEQRANRNICFRCETRFES